jgi:hypothetical protein
MSVRFAVSAAGALAATLLATSGAHAFCRTVANPTPAGYDPATQGCFMPASGSGSLLLYWKNLCVGYSLQKDASPLRQITLDQATRVAANAFAQWTGAACSAGGSPSIQVYDEGPVDCALVQYSSTQPNQHVIVFRDEGWPYSDSSNTLGLTTLTFDVTDGEIFDADMELNSHDYDLVAEGPVPAGSYDLASVITHEAGHFLGLAHSADTSAVMYAHYQPDATALTQDDSDGICSIYPAGGTRITSSGPLAADACDATPRHGFSSECATTDDGGTGASTDDGGTPVPLRHKSCSVGAGTGAGALGCGPLAIFALGCLGRLVRRRRRARSIAAAAVLALGAASATALATSDVHASVSIAVLFDELVRDSTSVVVATPIEQHAAWENGRIYTYTRLRVDTLVAGEALDTLAVRTLGGAVGRIGQIVEGEATFAIGQPSVLFLRRRAESFEVAARAQGQFAVVQGDDKRPHLAAATGTGALFPPSAARTAKVMQLNPAGGVPRFARDVLHGRVLEDAAHDIAAAWARLHAG